MLEVLSENTAVMGIRAGKQGLSNSWLRRNLTRTSNEIHKKPSTKLFRVWLISDLWPSRIFNINCLLVFSVYTLNYIKQSLFLIWKYRKGGNKRWPENDSFTKTHFNMYVWLLSNTSPQPVRLHSHPMKYLLIHSIILLHLFQVENTCKWNAFLNFYCEKNFWVISVIKWVFV